MISSSNVRRTACNETRMKNKIKNVNSNVILNTSNSDEVVKYDKSFLKGVNFLSLQNAVVNYAEIETIHEQNHGWWNSVTLKGNQ